MKGKFLLETNIIFQYRFTICNHFSSLYFLHAQNSSIFNYKWKMTKRWLRMYTVFWNVVHQLQPCKSKNRRERMRTGKGQDAKSAVNDQSNRMKFKPYCLFITLFIFSIISFKYHKYTKYKIHAFSLRVVNSSQHRN